MNTLSKTGKWIAFLVTHGDGEIVADEFGVAYHSGYWNSRPDAETELLSVVNNSIGRNMSTVEDYRVIVTRVEETMFIKSTTSFYLRAE